MLALTLTLPLLLELSEVELVSDIVSDPEALTLPEKEALRLAVSSDVELCDTENVVDSDLDPESAFEGLLVISAETDEEVERDAVTVSDGDCESVWLSVSDLDSVSSADSD